MMEKVAINGIGVVGGFGSGGDALAAALASGHVAPQKIDIQASGEHIPQFAFLAGTGDIDKFIPRRALRRVDHLSKMAVLGAFMAFRDAGDPDLSGKRIGLIIASGYGATRTTFSFLDSVRKNGDAFASPTAFSNSVHNAAAGHISILLKLSGPSHTVSQFDLSPASGLLTAAQWLAEDRVDHILFGAVDEYCDVLGYCHYRYFGPSEKGILQPADFERHTAVPGEGAAFFLLSKESRTPSPYGCITRVETGNLNRRKLSFPRDIPLIIGADGYVQNHSKYTDIVGENVEVGAYAALYGTTPMGQAFDLAIACLAMKNRTWYATPQAPASCGRLKVRMRETALENEHISCFKMGRAGGYGLMTLGPG